MIKKHVITFTNKTNVRKAKLTWACPKDSIGMFGSSSSVFPIL